MALEGGGKPVLIEAMSYRVSHHSTSDDSFAYRAKVEVEDWKRRDNPITRLRKWMEHQGLWGEEMEKEARSQIRKDLLKAFAQAEKEKKSPLRDIFTDVYEDLSEESKGQIKELGRLLDEYPAEYDVSEFEGGRRGLDEPPDE
jgi:2-oxoisovalerate dehydrogenase E1 component alpha subunit